MEGSRSVSLARHWAVLVGCCVLCVFAFALPLPCFGVFISPMVSYFGSSVTEVNLYFTCMTGAAVVSCSVGARLIERNVRVTVIIAAALMGASYLLLAAVPAVPLVWVAGIVAGLCYPLCSSILVPVMISRWFAARQATFTGIAFALVGAAGVVLGPALTACIQSFGWTVTLAGMGVSIIAACLLTAIMLIAPAPEPLGLMPYGAQDAAGKSGFDEVSGPPYSRMFGSPAFAFIIVAGLLSGFLGDYNTQANAMAQQSGFDPIVAGVAFSCVSGGLFVGKILLGWVRDAHGAVPAIGVGCLTGTAAFTLVSASLSIGSVALLYIGCAVAGLCTCLGTVAPALLCRDAFGQRAYAQAVGHTTAAINLGMAIGAPIYSLVFDLTGSYLPVAVACAIIPIVLFTASSAGIRSGRMLQDSQTN